MKLLILTQTLDSDDPVLGFFHTWVERFAEEAERVTVICLGEGKYVLPENVEVRSLGKERKTTKLGQLVRLYWYVFRERKNYDAVFVHMNPEYVVLCGPLWKMWKKKVVLWYAHRSVDVKLRLAEKLADFVATPSRESFRLSSKKARILGHGIDTSLLHFQSPDFSRPLAMLHVGRITRIKHIDTILRAARELIDRGVAIQSIELVGEPVTPEDKGYKTLLEGLSKTLKLEDITVWKGGLTISDVPVAYARSTITINAAPDGGMDKVVLESLAASRPAFVSNQTFKDIYGVYWPQFSYAHASPRGLADAIEAFLNMPESERRTALTKLAEKVRTEYDIGTLIRSIMALYQ